MPLYQPLITKHVFETENVSSFKPVTSNLVFDIFARLTSPSALLHRILQVLADAFVLRCLCVYAKKREREGERESKREREYVHAQSFHVCTPTAVHNVRTETVFATVTSADVSSACFVPA